MCPPTSNWHQYRRMASMSVLDVVLAYKWMCVCIYICIYMHTLRPDVAWTFSTWTCSYVLKLWKLLPLSYLYTEVHTTPFMCMITPYMCSVGNTLQRMLFVVTSLSVMCLFDSTSFSHLHKPADTNLFDSVNHTTAQRCFSENTQYMQFIFQFGMRGQGLFKPRLFS